MKRIPYGIDDFESIILDDLYFVDKTKYIPTVEERNRFLLFVRPRRMGKSLFVNMLMAYYDIAQKDRFDALFGKLWIGQHPTKEANKYLVLKFDFAKVNSGEDTLIEDFTHHCIGCVENFLDKYEKYFKEGDREFILSYRKAKEVINRLTSRATLRGLHLYLFIDEYDNFSNVVLSSRGVDAHHRITHGAGFYREFFKACKGAFRRIFMTGVAPITYDDLTSGFNIADVVALEPEFNDSIGVTETELNEMISYYRNEKCITRDTSDIVSEMKPWYDGFCFCNDCYGTQPPIYNTDMVMRYMQSMVSKGIAPKQMLDTNARTDYQKLNFLVMSEDLANRERRIQIVKEICSRGYTNGQVREQFPASSCGDEANFKSMLYYFGTLTFGGRDENGDTILKVPNKTMGELYLQYMLQIINQEGLDINTEVDLLEANVKDAAMSGKWQGLVDKLGDLYGKYTSLRNTVGRESDVNGFLRGILCMNRYYAIWPELELGNGFCDILLSPKNSQNCPTKYSYLIELKYMKAGESNIDYYVKEACDQLDRYAADYHLADNTLLRGTPLTKLYLIFQGNKLIKSGIRI